MPTFIKKLLILSFILVSNLVYSATQITLSPIVPLIKKENISEKSLNDYIKVGLGNNYKLTKIRYKNNYSRNLTIFFDDVIIYDGWVNAADSSNPTDIFINTSITGRILRFEWDSEDPLQLGDLEVYGVLKSEEDPSDSEHIPIVIDTDALHGVDDQMAIAFAIFRQDVFDIKGMVSNWTPNDSNYTISDMHNELVDIVALTGAEDQFPLRKGSRYSNNFNNLKEKIDNGEDFDGKEAARLIMNAAIANNNGKLSVISIGRVTNTALAIALSKHNGNDITNKISFHMMGTNFPNDLGLDGPNESDRGALRYILNSGTKIYITPGFAITGSVSVHPFEMKVLEGHGPVINPAIFIRSRGRYFDQFGDWVLNRWNESGIGDPRRLWDLGIIAPLLNPDLATITEYGAPDVVGNSLVKRPNNTNKVKVWSNFNGTATINSLLEAVKNPQQ